MSDEKKKDVVRINLTVSRELYEWITQKSVEFGSPVATAATILLNQMKYISSAMLASEAIFSFLDKLSPPERTLFLGGQKGYPDIINSPALQDITETQRNLLMSAYEQNKKDGDL